MKFHGWKLANLILFRITMEMTRISGQTELIPPCIVRGRDSRLNICVWTSSLRSKLLWAYQVWLPASVHGEAKWVRKEIADWSVDWPSRRRDWPLRRKVRFGFIFNYQRLRICLAVCLFALLRGYLRRKRRQPINLSWKMFAINWYIFYICIA